MPKESPHTLRMVLFCFLILPGCKTSPQANRIAELQSQYDQIQPSTKEALARGSIEIGNTPLMVYIALGKPDRIESSANAQDVTWIYQNFYPSAEVVSQPLYDVDQPSPLEDTRQAWMANLPKHPEINPAYPAKRTDESWATYTKKHPAHPGFTDSLEQERHKIDAEERRLEIGASNRNPVTLEVIFYRQKVIDAIVNGTTSAFSIPQ